MQTQCRQSVPRKCTATVTGALKFSHSVSCSRSRASGLETAWLAPRGLHDGSARLQAAKHQELCRATQQQQQQRQQQLPPQWPADLEPREADLLKADEALSGPILSGAGGGLFFWWELGAFLTFHAGDGLSCSIGLIVCALHRAPLSR